MKIGLSKEEVGTRLRELCEEKNIFYVSENLINSVAILIEENNKKIQESIEEITKEHIKVNNCSVH